MSPEQWRRVEELFVRAASIAEPDRAVLLESMEHKEAPEVVNQVKTLLENVKADDSFLERPVSGSSQLRALISESRDPIWQEGTVLAGRFRIDALIGEGGMGEVYRAWDLKLQERVALKCLPEIWWHDHELKTRLLREISLARKITHPNVCRIFDLSEHIADDKAFPLLTMEYLEGETLRDVLKPRVIPADRLFPLAIQLFEGLAAAHAQGIIHRDIKPSNLMLVPGGAGERLVILDFGLACDIETTEHTLTGSGRLLGTLSYMAPEQILGNADLRSDLFSAGLVLHECLTGGSPYGPQGTVSAVLRRLVDPAQPLRQRLPQLSTAWIRTIEVCLQRDPTARPANAAAAIAMLNGRRAQTRMRVPSRRMVLGAGAAAGALACFPLVRRYISSTGKPLPLGVMCMVTPLENATGDAELSALTILVRQQLLESRQIEPWDTARLPAVLATMRLPADSVLDAAGWREAARREGAGILVFSSLSQPGGEFVYSLRLETAGAEPSVLSLRAGSKATLLEKTRDGAKWIRERAGEAPQLLASTPTAASVTSESWEAIRLFDEAETGAKPVQQKILLLKEAVRVDAGFTLALMRLGDLLTAGRNLDEGLPYWRVAIDQGKNQHLTERERLYLASNFALEVWDFKAAEAAATRWASEFPADGMAHYLLFTAIFNQRVNEDTANVLARFPSHSRWATLRAQARAAINVLSGDLQRIGESARELAALGAQESSLRLAGIERALAKQWGAAEEEFQKMRKLGNRARSRAWIYLAQCAAQSGSPDRAEEFLKTGAADDSSSGQRGARAEKLTSLGYLACLRGDRRAARAWALEAAGFETGAQVSLRSATVLARAGFVGEAEQIAKGYHSPVVGPYYENVRSRMRGEILLARGRMAEAMGEFQAAARIESVAAPTEYLGNALRVQREADELREWEAQMAKRPGIFWIFPEQQFPQVDPAVVHSNTKSHEPE